MRRSTRTAYRLFADAYDPPGPVLEIGSLYLPGHGDIADFRSLFPERIYVGSDIRLGPGVDLIADGGRLPVADASLGTILMCEVLEHVPDPGRLIGEARRALRPDGLMAVSAPFNYPLHAFPSDYWRFTASGLWALLEPFPHRDVFALGPRVKPAFVFGVASMRESPIHRERQACFREATRAAYSRSGSRLRGWLDEAEARARDLFGLLLGRGEMDVRFFEPDEATGGYEALDRPADE